jgi:hypothetical protein
MNRKHIGATYWQTPSKRRRYNTADNMTQDSWRNITNNNKYNYAMSDGFENPFPLIFTIE